MARRRWITPRDRNLPRFAIKCGPYHPVNRGKKRDYYMAKFYIDNGNPDKVYSVSLGADKRQANRVLHDRIEERIRDVVAQTDPSVNAAAKPLTEHLKDYRTWLEAEGVTEKHVALSPGRTERLFAACDITHVSDISEQKIKAHLRRQIKRGKIGEQTALHIFTNAKAFTAWMAGAAGKGEQRNKARIDHDPLRYSRLTFKSSKSIPTPTFRRVEVSDDEFDTLLANAANGPVAECLTGEQRVHLYLLARFSGLRASECRASALGTCTLTMAHPTSSLTPA